MARRLTIPTPPSSTTAASEALIHGGIPHDANIEVEWVPSDRFTDQAAAGRLLKEFDGLLIPGGFGERGVEGMAQAVRWEWKLWPSPLFGKPNW